MRLSALLAGSAIGQVPPVDCAGLQYDSRKLSRGEVFFAFPGERVDGHRFVPQAIDAHAAAVVSERVAPAGLESRWARVTHGRRALAHAAVRFYGHPDRDVQVTAVTGTNGKTTTAHLIDSILRAAGRTTALLGTIEHRVGASAEKAVNTTPESLDVVRMLARLRDLGGTHATMEASSHALALERVRGMEFHVAVFTNLTPEHLDFHGDMTSYAAAKRRLFEGAGAAPPRFAVVNADDETGRDFLRLGVSRTISYGRGAGADVWPRRVAKHARGMSLTVATPSGQVAAETPLVGDCNVDNLLAAVATAQCNGIGNETIERGLRSVQQVPGRFERIDEGQPFVAIVDYAHTEDALRRLIVAAREIAGSRRARGRVLTLFGCGGDRDRSKRAPMGAAAAELSDLVVATSDNPRSEDPLRILGDVEVGLRGGGASWSLEPDRASAISSILAEADAGDVVLIAGKGHETTQTMRARTVEFDDRQAVRSALARMGYGRP